MPDILVVEDEFALGEFVRRALDREGIRHRLAQNGAEALSLAVEQWPAAVLLDLTLPGALDGWQIFRLYLMPFCVSSFAALVKDAGYILVFPPTLHENLVGLGLIIVFIAVVFALRALRRKTPEPVLANH